jgi:hypothetical protein
VEIAAWYNGSAPHPVATTVPQGARQGSAEGTIAKRFRGTATFNGSPRNVAGVYGAGGAGAAIGRGAQAIVLANQSGAVLALTGYQRGLQINADLSGLALSMQ